MKSIKVTSIIAILGSVAAANATVSIDVTPNLAPNVYGSPSYSGYLANALYALQNGLSSYGDSTKPTYFSAVTSPISRSSAVVTGFKSWMGQADPTGVFANELGNRMTFGVFIQGNGEKISISQLSFLAQSVGDSNQLGFSNAAGVYTYNANWVGIIYGTDGPTYITSGLNTQLVDAIVGRGSSCSYAAYEKSGFTHQQLIDKVANSPTAQWTSYTGTYTLGGVSGSGSFNALGSAVPGPAAALAFVAGLAATAKRRRK